MPTQGIFEDLPEGLVLKGSPTKAGRDLGGHAMYFIAVEEIARLLVDHGEWAAIKINGLLPHLKYTRTEEDFKKLFLPGIDEAVDAGLLRCNYDPSNPIVWPTPKLAALMQ